MEENIIALNSCNQLNPPQSSHRDTFFSIYLVFVYLLQSFQLTLVLMQKLNSLRVYLNALSHTHLEETFEQLYLSLL